jgi:cytochrome c biogenesis protein CcdA
MDDVRESVHQTISLVVGVAIVLLLIIFMGVLQGNSFSLTESSIRAIAPNIDSYESKENNLTATYLNSQYYGVNNSVGLTPVSCIGATVYRAE